MVLRRKLICLGLQYVYKTGYAPAAFIDFFERMEALERKKKGTVSQLFRSHPKHRCPNSVHAKEC